MEALRIGTKRWWLFVFAAFRYTTYTVLLTYHQWHAAVKDQWTTLTSWDIVNIACLSTLAFLMALGALMNGEWQKAVNNSNPK